MRCALPRAAAAATSRVPVSSVSRIRRRGLVAAWMTTSASSTAAATPAPVRTSPRRASTPAGSRGAGRRDSTRTSWPASASSGTSTRPSVPVPPVTRTAAMPGVSPTPAAPRPRGRDPRGELVVRRVVDAYERQPVRGRDGDRAVPYPRGEDLGGPADRPAPVADEQQCTDHGAHLVVAERVGLHRHQDDALVAALGVEPAQRPDGGGALPGPAVGGEIVLAE